MKGKITLFSKLSDDWNTPQWLFDELSKEFNFCLDLAASDDNKKCLQYISNIDGSLEYFLPHFDSIRKGSYFAWCNPPYSKQRKFVEFSINNKVPTVFLLPARTDTRLFHDLIYPYSNLVTESYLFSNYKTEVRFLKGRLKFKRGKSQIDQLTNQFKDISQKLNDPTYTGSRLDLLEQRDKTVKELTSNDGAAFPSMIVIYRPDEYAHFLKNIKCKACGKTRSEADINTFKHPIVVPADFSICGYHHFQYCYDSLPCYVKASMRDELIKSE